MLAPETGSLVNGRYRLMTLLGVGGMGAVWRTRDEQRSIEVALKFLHPDFANRHAILTRFAGEAELASRMFSRNIVRVLDRGLADDNPASPFIVYELLEGEDLATHLDRVGHGTPAVSAEIITQVCRALERAHAVGVVHRDIKPANLFLCNEDDRLLVKVLDFGIAKFRSITAAILLEKPGESLPPGSLTGTLEHMSPEHVLDGAPTDVRGDLYAVGVVGYRCLTGRVPYIGNVLGQLVVALARGPAPEPSSLVPGIPAAVDDFFARALHRQPSERFQTAAEMAKHAIAAFRAKVGACGDAGPRSIREERVPPSRVDPRAE